MRCASLQKSDMYISQGSANLILHASHTHCMSRSMMVTLRACSALRKVVARLGPTLARSVAADPGPVPLTRG